MYNSNLIELSRLQWLITDEHFEAHETGLRRILSCKKSYVGELKERMETWTGAAYINEHGTGVSKLCIL